MKGSTQVPDLCCFVDQAPVVECRAGVDALAEDTESFWRVSAVIPALFATSSRYDEAQPLSVDLWVFLSLLENHRPPG